MMNLSDVQKNGVVGAGGAGFPTHVKLASKSEVLIMNASECEPLLHKDMALLENFHEEILDGFEKALFLTGASRGIIGIKGKNRGVIDLLTPGLNSRTSLIAVDDFYPAGDEITLIYETTGRVVQPGQLPITVGCLVQNVETLYNISKQEPVVEKYISVAGAVETPATVKVPIGISYADVLSAFQITVPSFAVRAGGLMMGTLSKDLSNVVTKRTGALIILPTTHYCVTMYERFTTQHDVDRIAKAGCDQCTFCTDLCPRYLLGHPVRPETAMRNRMFAREEASACDLGSAFCCECNLCTLYACPESLDPKGATVIEKQHLLENQVKWEGLPVSPHPMMPYRKVPTRSLKQRLDVTQYRDEGPLKNIDFTPETVRIPLQQHIGAPSRPVVKEGDRVNIFDLIAESTGNISTNMHASITGYVREVTQNDIVIYSNP